jgi:hypothetical protein
MMEAAYTSETSVYIQLRTRQYIPEDSELHTRRRENLKSHIINQGYFCDGTHRIAVPEVISQKDASRNGVPGTFFLATV